MQSNQNPDPLPISLYHGTSSLFLADIVKFGLGGRNPIVDWKVIEFAKAILPLAEEHLAQRPRYMAKVGSFRLMVEQKQGKMNFQHGDTYLSPSELTAVRYASNKKYGSELLTYTLDFLEELVRLKIEGVATELYQSYPEIFEKLDISPAPLLIRVDAVRTSDLLAEDGSDSAETVKRVCDAIQAWTGGFAQQMLQQMNFRLRRPVAVGELRICLIDVTRWDPSNPEYTLYPLTAEH